MSRPRKYFGTIGEIRAGLGFDETRLVRYLTAKLPEFRGPVTVKQFDGGQSNPTYQLRAFSGLYVLRRKPPGVLLATAHAVDREYRVLKALFESGFPVPEPLVLCLDTEVIGSQFYVMRFVEGRIFFDCTLPDLSAAERSKVFDSVNATLARLALLEPAALGLADFGKAGNYFTRQIARWTRQYEAARTGDIPEMDQLIGWLPKAVPPDDGRIALVHGDFSLHNILISAEDGRVAAVIDWELSTLGHPYADLTYHLMEWYRPAGIDPRGTLRDRDLTALGIPTIDEYIARFCERARLGPIGSLTFYKAFNLFRVASILQGVAQRAALGNAAASDAFAAGARVRPLAVAAWQEVLDAGGP